MEELELYKLLMTEDNEHETALAQEIRWAHTPEGDKLLVWINIIWIKEFIESLVKIFGNGIFDDGSFDGNFQEDCVCIDLEYAVGNCVDLEKIFPKDKYKEII